MGTGKSTIGKVLSKQMNLKYIETDDIIADKVKQPLNIYVKQHELAFRALEKEFCHNLDKIANSVISCGGGIIIEPENIKKLKEYSYVVLLTAEIDTILGRVRVEGLKKRPLIKEDEARSSIQKILKKRSKFYLKAADLIITTDNKSPKEISTEIIKHYRGSLKNE